MTSRSRRYPLLPRALSLLVLLVTLLLAAGAPARAAGEGRAVPPADQTPFLGALLDWATDSTAAHAKRLGAPAALYGHSISLPMSAQEQGHLRAYFGQVSAQGAHALLTIHPAMPLTNIDGSRASALAAQVADAATGYEGKVFVRFGPQMNASWVRWGQRPEAYRDAFGVIATAMDSELGNPVMVWSPTAANDYPFRAPSTTAPSGGALGTLDTDGNGEWNLNDDPYAPYYPGDDVVDWVGLSAYHDETRDGPARNAVPAPGEFKALLGDAEPVGPPAAEDFYAAYASGKDKPLMVETAAFYSPGIQGGPVEAETKRLWWQQVLAAPGHGYDRIAAVVWNETIEQRQDGALNLDGRVTHTPDLAAAFADGLQTNGTVTGPMFEQSTLDGVAPVATGTALEGHTAWTVAAAVLAAALALCLLPLWRPVREWAHAGNSSRDARIDMLRGAAIIFVVVNHVGITSFFQLLTQESIGVVSGAELFVLLSGTVLGLVYGPRTKDALGDVVDRTSKRAWKLYLTALVIVLIIFALSNLPFLNATALTTFTDQGTGAAGNEAAGTAYDLYAGMAGFFQFPVPDHLIPALFLLQVGPWQFNIMGLYVILLALSPLVLMLLSRGMVWLVLTVSLGLYILGISTQVRLLPSQFEDSFPLLIWQVLFVLGMVAGYYRRQVVAWFSHPRQRALLWACVLLAAALAIFSWTSPYFSNNYDIRLALLPEPTFRAVYDGFFGRTGLEPGRLLNVLLVIITGYAMLSAYWRPLERALGWFLIPLGQATLYVFILHVFMIIGVANIPALRQGNIWINTAASIVILALLWTMVKTRFLFRIIPR
ncbi:OpgC domain-containing protein [Arthrobacter sp. AQ5-05]|uniref:OpgC domain-containing protein n=1 Tax=Arthrobacter sp. AQ5-05 TaxID=2184581 RepID=UPI000DCE18CC|nr:OpgC domain-containing protein [Arthrobacter sp. AQ5-05]RAX46211.1 OpgC domain-containing protein [Arthrobacter sp. AQ5-05]